MVEIVLTTLNAKWTHASLGLRALRANLGVWRDRSIIREFEIHRAPREIVAAILADDPRIVGFGVYIWNAVETLHTVAMLKRVRPDVVVVLGGPEVSYETEEQEIVRLADYVVTGEGDLAFRSLVTRLLAGERPAERIHAAAPVRFEDMELPYEEYTDEDVAHRVVYVEASRGCPFECEFCLSALDIPVRAAALERFLPAMQRLLDRGLRQFKFVDRTFNLNLPFAQAILEFFRERLRPGLFLHFEMIPDRLPAGLRDLIAAFPPGTMQFEVGVQTLDDATATRISRRQDLTKLEQNLLFLRDQTNVHVHADLIVGLPGEDETTFARGFDRLQALGPAEIQVGILKRLRGTPIVRHTESFGMVYSPYPPYEILATAAVPFADLQRMTRFARTWDLVANSGNFIETARLLWTHGASVYAQVTAFSEWLHEKHGAGHGIALARLAEYLQNYLVAVKGLDRSLVGRALWTDWRRSGRADRPAFLRDIVPDTEARAVRAARLKGQERQSRHRG